MGWRGVAAGWTGLFLVPVCGQAQEITEVWQCTVPAGCEGEACMQAVSPMMVFLAVLPDGGPGAAVWMPSGTLPAAVIEETGDSRRLRVGRKEGVAPVTLITLGADGTGMVSLSDEQGSFTFPAACAAGEPEAGDR